jgi:LCP family protein required for cell wall assembly
VSARESPARLRASVSALVLSRKRRSLFIALGSLLAIVLAVLIVSRAWPDQFRHAAAQSFRATLGPPAPATMLIEDEPPNVFDDPRSAMRFATVPDAELATPPTPDRPADLEGVSFVLLLGADNRSDAVTGRTDTMIVAAFRHRDGKIAAFNIPRDLWVALPDLGTLHEEGRTHARISSVVRVGEVRLGKGQGMPLLRQTLRDQLGIRFDRFVTVDFAGFVGLVDAVGGVDVDVDCPIVDCFWNQGTDKPCELLTIEAGRTHMTGATALQFVRSRHGRGDHDRTKRQQDVMLAFARKVRARGLGGLPGLWRTAEPFVTSDLEVDDAAYYASFALDNQPDEIRGFSIRHPMTSRHVTEDGKHVMVLDRAAFDRALADLFEGELSTLRERKECPAADVALHSGAD